MLDGQPGYPKIKTCVVDVRDVADLHLRAMTDPAAKGERFLATSGESLWLVEIAKLLKEHLGTAGAGISTRVLPNLLVRSMALTNPAMKGLVPLLGARLDASGDEGAAPAGLEAPIARGGDRCGVPKASSILAWSKSAIDGETPRRPRRRRPWIGKSPSGLASGWALDSSIS